MKISEIALRTGSIFGFLSYMVYVRLEGKKEVVVFPFSQKPDVIAFISLLLDKQDVSEEELIEALKMVQEPKTVVQKKRGRKPMTDEEKETPVDPNKWTAEQRYKVILSFLGSKKELVPSREIWDYLKSEGDLLSLSGCNQILKRLLKKGDLYNKEKKIGKYHFQVYGAYDSFKRPLIPA
jgi:hypothetical protein